MRAEWIIMNCVLQLITNCLFKNRITIVQVTGFARIGQHDFGGILAAYLQLDRP